MKNFHSLESNEIECPQFIALKKQLQYVEANSKYYQQVFSKIGIKVDEILNYEDFRKIPITSKEDLQKFNADFISVAHEEIIDYVTTSGTLGKPVSFALNDPDLQRLAENERKSFEMVGVTKKDVVQITTTLDRRFMAGMAYFLGLRELGAGIVRTGSGLPGLQWESIERFKPKYLVAVPSFLLKMIEYALFNNIDFKNSSVKAAICIGEPLRNTDFSLNALGKKINELWDIELFSTYASTEMGTAFTECSEHKGNHSLPELIFSEILDENGNPVSKGEIGELIVTPLQVQTMPLVRFATGDMVKVYEKGCNCGRNSLRISTPIGRKMQMIKLKGTSLYPQQIIELLNSFGRLSNFVIEANTDEMGNDNVVIKIPDTFPATEIAFLKEHLQSGLKVNLEIIQIPSEEINLLKFPKESRKPMIFRDLR